MIASRRSGFTLVELLIVVVILAMLAAIVVPASVGVRTETEQAAFAAELRILVDAAALYTAKTQRDLEDASSGVIPTGFEDYLDSNGWEDGTPVGGVWDSERDAFGFGSTLGVHFVSGTPRSDAYMETVDALVDDGDLATGGFRKLAPDRFAYILAE